MYEQIMRRFRRAVRAGRLRFTNHALEELADDDLAIADARHCLLTGEIVADQYDVRYRQVKYEFFGAALNGTEIGLIARWEDKDGGVLVITAYRLRIDDFYA